MRIGRNTSSNRTRVVVLTADEEFDRSARATFGASSAIDLTMVSGRIAEQGDTLDVARRHRRGGRSRCRPRRRDAGARPADGACRRLAAGDRGDAELRRERRAYAAADADRRLPGEAGGADRSGARLRPRRQGTGRRRRADRSADLHVSCPRSAAPASPRWRFRPPCCCSTAAARASSRRPAWSISISSTARSPTISISSRASIWRKSSRGRTVSTGNCWKSCCRITPPAWRWSPRRTGRPRCARSIPTW